MSDPADQFSDEPADAAPAAPSPWDAIDLNRPGYADLYPGGLGDFSGVAPDLGHRFGQAFRAVFTGQDPDTVHPSVRPLMGAAATMLRPDPPLGPGLFGSLDQIKALQGTQAADGTAPAAGGDQGLNENDGAEQPDRAASEDAAVKLRQRDVDYLDRYYDAASRYSQQYKVNPAFVLGLGSESGFGTVGTYTKTGDAFGMTGGNTRQMTNARSPEENVREFFQNFGSRIYGVGDDGDAFISALQARDAKGRPVANLKKYNSENSVEWEKMARDGIGQIQRDLPVYLPTRSSNPRSN